LVTLIVLSAVFIGQARLHLRRPIVEPIVLFWDGHDFAGHMIGGTRVIGSRIFGFPLFHPLDWAVDAIFVALFALVWLLIIRWLFGRTTNTPNQTMKPTADR
jgi:hypothetical protein